MKSNRGYVLIIIGLILMVLILTFAYCSDHRGQYVVGVFPALDISGEVDYVPAGSTNAVITTSTGFYLRSYTTEQEIHFENPEDNPFGLIVEVYLGDGTLLYKSDYIAPGESVDNITLEQKLAPGTYHNCVLVYTCCARDFAHTPLTRCDMNIEITVM